MIYFILAAGKGTRLWPLSRENYPKQFMDFKGKRLLEHTIERFYKKNNIYIVSSKNYEFLVKNIGEKYSIKNFIFENKGNGTLGAIIKTIKYIQEYKNYSDDEIISFFPADHIISPVNKFNEYLNYVEKKAQNSNNIFLFGINPTNPSTGYGYIKIKNNLEDKLYDVEEFKEKPNKDVAEQYLLNGNYLWNSGIFIGRISAFKEQINKFYDNKIFNLSYKDLEKKLENYKDLSFDKEILEKNYNIKCIKLNINWSDLGSWDSIYENLEKDSDNNAKVGNIIANNSKNNLIITEENKRLVCVNNIDNLLIIDTIDALYIGKKGDSESIKNIINLIKNKNEFKESPKTYRPWGYYTVFDKGENYKIKKIVVKAGKKLSLQLHFHRSEHWIVTKGTGVIHYGDFENKKIHKKIIRENESFFVETGVIHRLENPGKIDLEIIEIQTGTYIEEDDIKRLEDDWGRK